MNRTRRRVLGIFRHQPEHGPAHHHLRMDRSPGAESVGRNRGRNVCHLWWDPCHGGQPYFHFVVCPRKEVIGQIHVCDTTSAGRISPKKLSDFLNMSSGLRAELRSAGSQSLACGVLDLYHGKYVESD